MLYIVLVKSLSKNKIQEAKIKNSKNKEVKLKKIRKQNFNYLFKKIRKVKLFVLKQKNFFFETFEFFFYIILEAP